MANDQEEYEAQLKEPVTANRRALSEFFVELEEVKASRQEVAAQAAQAANITEEAEQ